jgi:hypothetical protein
MVAVVIITVGMVFVLGAFSRSMVALATAERTIQANELLMAQIVVLDMDGRQPKPAIALEASGTFAEPHEGFIWSRSTRGINIDFDHTYVKSLAELFAEETVSVSWMQSRVPKSVSVTRFVQKRIETP